MSMAFPPSAPPPLERAVLRRELADFEVREVCPVVPDPGGEHLWLRVRKKGWNSADVARVLARATGLRIRDVGYAGLKDRNAMTEQWFSLWVRRRAEPSLDGLPEGIEVLERRRCARKLRRGMHTSNRFRIRLREVAGDWERLEARLGYLAERGFPNYFGPQRFGRNHANVTRAARYFEAGDAVQNRHVRGIWISAARAWIFNQVLKRRVEQGWWGDLAAGDVPDATGMPTGPLWGVGPLASSGSVAALEEAVATAFPLLREGLERTGMPMQRRPLVARAHGLHWVVHRREGIVELAFALDPGVYATALLAELADTRGA